MPGNLQFDANDTCALWSMDGHRLHCRRWQAAKPQAAVVLVHGLAEHIGRYDYVAQQLATQGFDVYGFDLRGHGLSEGKRIYVDRFRQYVDDLRDFAAAVQPANDGRPWFILAHSMGTTVALQYLIDHRPTPRGVVLTGAALSAGANVSKILVSLSGAVGKLFPKLPTVALDSRTISKDASVVSAYLADPLVYNGKIPARTGAALNGAFAYIRSKMHELAYPMLIMHGGSDQLTDPAGSQDLYAGIASRDKSLRLLEGLFHEVLNEPERDEVIHEIVEWIAARCYGVTSI